MDCIKIPKGLPVHNPQIYLEEYEYEKDNNLIEVAQQKFFYSRANSSRVIFFKTYKLFSIK